MNAPLLEISGLGKRYPVRKGLFGSHDLVAAEDVTLSLHAGETLALVGESGSGKSTVGRCILRLEAPSFGTVRLDDKDITSLPEADIRVLRAQMQMVYQEPLESLNPRHPVGALVEEPLMLHGIVPKAELRNRTVELFNLVGLGEEHLERYPHELSGGQQQRVGIARALSTNPRLLVLDEPTSALDVSVEAQILNLLQDLQRQFGLAYLFISHDLAVVSMLADRIAVMYLGQIVESGPTNDVLFDSYHPYTQALVSATPVDHPRQRKTRIVLSGEPASPIDPPAHCRLVTRCSFAKAVCKEVHAELETIRNHRATRCTRFRREHIEGKWQPRETSTGQAEPQAHPSPQR